MKKKTLSRLLTIVFMISIYGYRVQAVNNSTLSNNIKNDKSGTKSRVMNIYKKNKAKKNFKQGEILVKIKAGTSNSSVESVGKKYSMKTKEHLKKQLDVVKFDSKKYDLDEVLLNLNNNSNIEYAEPNYISKLSSSPSMEPDFSKMWGLNNTSTKGKDINVENAWKTTTGNPNLVVGIIDTGIDYNHKDLKSNIWINNKEIVGNGKDDDNDGYIDDYNGWDFAYGTNDSFDDNSHGTHISGIIAASANGIGTVGVAPTVKIMPLKVADNQGDLYTSDVVSAIQYGISHGVKIFNCSFGGADFSQAEYDAIKNSNALFVCAAGNGDANGNGLNNDNAIKNYPSSFDLPNIISVAAMKSDGTLSTFSNYGAISVDIAAPGSDIYSTVPGGYAYKSGTSMATPHVTAVAALVLSTNMNLTPIEVKNSIMKSTNKLPISVKKISTGSIVDAFGAMRTASPSMVFGVTDVDKDGTTDSKDLAYVGSAYNSRVGDSKYKDILDINNDGMIDIYDLVNVSKDIK